MANERRLIDANALLERLAYSTTETWAKNIERIRVWWPHAVGIKDNIVSLIKDAPTVDAVEVVRCKDCKHWKDGVAGCTDHVKCCEIGFYMVGENGYCVYGERKEDNA